MALQLCHELGLPPMASIGKIAVINGTPSLFGEMPLALVMKSGLLEDIQESVEMDGKDPLRATCAVKRKGMSPMVREFTRDDATRAGLWGKGVWAKYPKRMIQMRARGHAIKDAFPDVLSGVSIAEYDWDTVVDDNGASIEVSRKTSSLNDTFGKKTE